MKYLSIDELPLNYYKYLTNQQMQTVCLASTKYRLLIQSQLFERLKPTPHNQKELVNIISCCTRLVSYVTKLDLTSLTFDNQQTVDLMLVRCYNLTNLKIRMDNITSNNKQLLINLTKQLETLKIYPPIIINNSTGSELVAKCYSLLINSTDNTLSSIKLYQLNISKEEWVCLMNKLRLRSFSIKQCLNYNDSVVRSHIYLELLKKICLVDCDISLYGMKIIVTKCSQLQYLEIVSVANKHHSINISYSELVTDQLKVLKLQNLNIDNNFVALISLRSELLRNIQLAKTSVTDHFVLMMNKKINLQILKIHNTAMITDKCLTYLAQMYSNKVSIVHIVGCNVSSPIVINKFVKTCTKLKRLVINTKARIENKIIIDLNTDQIDDLASQFKKSASNEFILFDHEIKYTEENKISQVVSMFKNCHIDKTQDSNRYIKTDIPNKRNRAQENEELDTLGFVNNTYEPSKNKIYPLDLMTDNIDDQIAQLENNCNTHSPPKAKDTNDYNTNKENLITNLIEAFEVEPEKKITVSDPILNNQVDKSIVTHKKKYEIDWSVKGLDNMFRSNNRSAQLNLPNDPLHIEYDKQFEFNVKNLTWDQNTDKSNGENKSELGWDALQSFDRKFTTFDAEKIIDKIHWVEYSKWVCFDDRSILEKECRESIKLSAKVNRDENEQIEW